MCWLVLEEIFRYFKMNPVKVLVLHSKFSWKKLHLKCFGEWRCEEHVWRLRGSRGSCVYSVMSLSNCCIVGNVGTRLWKVHWMSLVGLSLDSLKTLDENGYSRATPAVFSKPAAYITHKATGAAWCHWRQLIRLHVASSAAKRVFKLLLSHVQRCCSGPVSTL